MITIYHNVTDHFDYVDFRCPCCLHLPLTDLFFRHVTKLEDLRQALGFAISVNSGYRCYKHNKEVGGAQRSWHLNFATDIRPSDNDVARLALLLEGARHRFNGIGIGSTFVHCDLRPNKSEWTY